MIGTEEAWALTSFPRRWRSSAPAPRGPRSPPRYARLGTEVLLFEALDRVLPTEDADISKVAERGLKRQGITVHTGTFVEDIESAETSVTFTFGAGEGEVDWLVIAAGRGPDIEALGLEQAGVKLEQTAGLIEVDGAMRTSAEGIYAIGDLVHGPALAHKASDEGVIAVEDAAGLETHPIEYIDIPRATFCTPNVGELRADRGSRPATRATTSSSARSSTARSAPAPCTATAPAWSRSSATSTTASCSAGTSSAPRRPS